MPLPVVVFAVHFPTNTSVVEVALVALREISSILFRRCSSGRRSGSMNGNSLWFLCCVWDQLLLLILPKFSFIVPPFSLIMGGSSSTVAGPVVDKLLGQILGTLESSGFRGQYTILNLG